MDITFNPGSGANSYVYGIALQSDGRIIIGGSFSSVNNIARNRVARLNSDGGLDTAFDPLQGPNGNVEAVAVQSDGKVFIGGGFTGVDTITRRYFARLRADGSLDLSFASINFDGDVNSIVIRTNGQLQVGGGFGAINGTARKNIARLNTDGSLDSSFNPGSGLTSGTIFASVVQSDDKVIIAGNFTTNNPVSRKYIARVNPDGSPDATFDAGYIGGR